MSPTVEEGSTCTTFTAKDCVLNGMRGVAELRAVVEWSYMEGVRVPYLGNKAAVWSWHPGPSPEENNMLNERKADP